jgi:hypothetical protein
MTRQLILSFLIIAIVLSVALAQGPEWIRFAPEGSGFAVMLPAQPKEQTETKEQFTSHFYTVSAGKAIFLIGYGDYAPTVRLDPQAELAANRDNFNKGLKARLLQSTQITMDGRIGLEFTSETAQVDLKSRVFLVNNRVFQMASLVYKGNDESRSVEKFFDSFAFTTKQ